VHLLLLWGVLLSSGAAGMPQFQGLGPPCKPLALLLQLWLLLNRGADRV
jgi:hypothetical protein